MTDLLIVVHTCEAYEKVRCNHILDTWYLDIPRFDGVDILFWTDNPSSQLPNPVCRGAYEEGATYHPTTVLKIFDYFANDSNHRWLLLIDDDSFLNLKALNNYLKMFDPSISYVIGDFLNWPLYRESHWNGFAEKLLEQPFNPSDEYQFWPGGGPGIVFSRVAVMNLLNIAAKQKAELGDSFPPCIPHDLWIHFLLKSNPRTALRVHCPGFHQYGNNEDFKIDERNSNLLSDENGFCPDRIISVHLNGHMSQMREFNARMRADLNVPLKDQGLKVIYDLGSNNGDDIPYYLLKAHKVIAVEANPVLCEQIESRFQQEIREKRLVVENCAVTANYDGESDFYVHKEHHVLSTLVAPSGLDASVDTRLPEHAAGSQCFEKIKVKAVSLLKLMQKHGYPYYVKVDIEGYDEEILAALVCSGVKPQYISAESHTLGVFAILSEKMDYQSFKLIDGPSVSSVYENAQVCSSILDKCVTYDFPHHSAGPFGNDINGEWMDKKTLLKILAESGLGWKDIHASSVDPVLHG